MHSTRMATTLKAKCQGLFTLLCISNTTFNHSLHSQVQSFCLYTVLSMYACQSVRFSL